MPDNPSFLSRLWKAVNSPIGVILVLLVLFLLFSQTKSVYCKLEPVVNEDILREGGWSEQNIKTLKMSFEIDSKYNNISITFDSYQEAAAYREILRDYDDLRYWVDYYMTCKPILKPADASDFIKNIN